MRWMIAVTALLIGCVAPNLSWGKSAELQWILVGTWDPRVDRPGFQHAPDAEARLVHELAEYLRRQGARVSLGTYDADDEDDAREAFKNGSAGVLTVSVDAFTHSTTPKIRRIMIRLVLSARVDDTGEPVVLMTYVYKSADACEDAARMTRFTRKAGPTLKRTLAPRAGQGRGGG